VDVAQRSAEQQARWLMAQLLDWHRRESKATWWEKFRLAAMDEQELLDDRAGLAGMKFVQRLGIKGGIPTDRYSYEKQETEARCDVDLYYPGEDLQGERFGCVIATDAVARTVDVKKTRKTAELQPTATFVWERPYPTDKQADALFRAGEWVADNGIDVAGRYRAGRDLLLRRAPRLLGGETLAARAGEATYSTATRVVTALDDSVFAIQGPPGAGKTYNGARMICELVRQGKKVAVSALSHKVIRNLLKAVVEAAIEKGVPTVRCAHLEKEGEAEEGIVVLQDNDEAMEALRTGNFNVVGATSYLWAGEPAFECVDVMFIDEAGQMSVADVLGVSQAARRLVLLGDPQQLERPLKGSHPDGAEKSALEHLLGPHKTIPPDMGFLLPETWRLHPKICEFTSTVFYESKLGSNQLAYSRVIEGHPWLDGAGLWFMPVEHAGNRNSSAEEVEVIAGIVGSLLKPGVRWYRGAGNIRDLKAEDILIVAPYNAQVADLGARLPGMRIGTVDKFQGQEAPVVIYSLTTSTPEDAPRGMEFLYSLNRLNVATSRAMSAVRGCWSRIAKVRGRCSWRMRCAGIARWRQW
jgi:AAA domain